MSKNTHKSLYQYLSISIDTQEYFSMIYIFRRLTSNGEI